MLRLPLYKCYCTLPIIATADNERTGCGQVQGKAACNKVLLKRFSRIFENQSARNKVLIFSRTSYLSVSYTPVSLPNSWYGLAFRVRVFFSYNFLGLPSLLQLYHVYTTLHLSDYRDFFFFWKLKGGSQISIFFNQTIIVLGSKTSSQMASTLCQN